MKLFILAFDMDLQSMQQQIDSTDLTAFGRY